MRSLRSLPFFPSLPLPASAVFVLLLLEMLRMSVPFSCQVLEGVWCLLFGFAPGKQIGNLFPIGLVYFSSNLSALKKKKKRKSPSFLG